MDCYDLKLSQYLFYLYHEIKPLNSNDFKKNIFSCLRDIIIFDKIQFISGSFKKKFTMHSHYEYNVNNSVSSDDKSIFYFVKKSVTESSDITTYSIKNNKSIKFNYFNENNLHNKEGVLISGCKSDVAGIYTVIVLQKSYHNDYFSENDRAIKSFITPHLLEILSSNYFYRESNKAKKEYGALCSKQGLLIYCENKFVNFLLKEWPEWKGPELPNPLTNYKKNIYKLKNIKFKFYNQDEINYIIVVSETKPFDHLTKRQQQVALGVASGKPYKQVANELGISSATVTNHMHAVYDRMNIKNKAELAGALS